MENQVKKLKLEFLLPNLSDLEIRNLNKKTVKFIK